MPIPTHLEAYASLIADGAKTEFALCSPEGNQWLNVCFFGSLRDGLIVNSPAPLLLTARDPVSGTEFTVFDSACHGYNPNVCGYFCSGSDDLSMRQMQAYPVSPLKITVTLEYDEEDNFAGEYDPGMYRDSFTWITVTAEDRAGKRFTLLDFETA